MAGLSEFVVKYLQRIGCEGLHEVSVKNLFKLQQKHLEHTVFENVSCYFKKELKIDKDFLFNKIVVGKKGGFCCELNTLFYFLLKELGYDVKIFQGTVYNGRTNKLIPSAMPAHVFFMVNIDGKNFLADVGLGCRGFLHPLEFKEGETDQGLHGIFKLTKVDPKCENEQKWILQSKERYGRPSNPVEENFKDGWCNEYVFKEKFINLDDVQEMLDTAVKDPLFIFNRVLAFERLLPTGYKILFGDDFSDIQFNVEENKAVVNTVTVKTDVEKLNIIKTHFNCNYVESFEG